MVLVKLVFMTFFSFSVCAGSFDPESIPECFLKVLIDEIPNLIERGYKVSNRYKRFIKQVKEDTSIKLALPEKRNDYHWKKHQNNFVKIGVSIRIEQDYLDSAVKFASSEGQNRIVFVSKFDGLTYKVDLDDGRVLIVSPGSSKLITYYIALPQVFGYSSILEFVAENLFYGEGRSGR